MIVAVTDPDEIRKASAFVTAVAEVEARFGFRLALPHTGDLEGDEDIDVLPTFGPRDAYALVRTEHKPGALVLALVTNPIKGQETTA